MRIAVIVPSIPPRARLLARALESIATQSRQADEIHVRVDSERMGAADTRDMLLAAVTAQFVAPVDDDDVLYPAHLDILEDALINQDADLVFPWFDVVGGTDPFPQHEGKPWDDENPTQIPITMLARTEAIRASGGWSFEWDASTSEDPGVDADGNRAGEDHRLVLRMVAAGCKIVHVPVRTWAWHHDSGNTSGLASRW